MPEEIIELIREIEDYEPRLSKILLENSTSINEYIVELLSSYYKDLYNKYQEVCLEDIGEENIGILNDYLLELSRKIMLIENFIGYDNLT